MVTTSQKKPGCKETANLTSTAEALIISIGLGLQINNLIIETIGGCDC